MATFPEISSQCGGKRCSHLPTFKCTCEQRPIYNLVPIKIQTEALISNQICLSYSSKAAKVTKNSTILLLV